MLAQNVLIIMYKNLTSPPHVFFSVLSHSFLILPVGQSIKMFIRGRPITMYIPSNISNYEELKMDLPSQKLELDWVYPK